MPRSFAWGPKTPLGTCAIGLINGRVAVTRLLPQVSPAEFIHLIDLMNRRRPSTNHPHIVSAPRRRLWRNHPQRSAPALRSVPGLELRAAGHHRKRTGQSPE
jgi:hypothetical protein